MALLRLVIFFVNWKHHFEPLSITFIPQSFGHNRLSGIEQYDVSIVWINKLNNWLAGPRLRAAHCAGKKSILKEQTTI